MRVEAGFTKALTDASSRLGRIRDNQHHLRAFRITENKDVSQPVHFRSAALLEMLSIPELC